METVFDKPLDTELLGKQNATDNTLTTTAKTVVGAINENASGISSNSTAISKLDSNANSTTDILATALTCTKTAMFKGAGSNYTGSVPNQAMRYGTFFVNVISSDKFVLCQSTAGVYYNSYSGNSWSGWQELAIKGETAQTIKIADYENTGEKTISVSSSTFGGAGTFLLSVQSINALYRYVGVLTVANQFFVDKVSGDGITVTGERTGSSQGNIIITPSSNYGAFQIKVFATRLSST